MDINKRNKRAERLFAVFFLSIPIIFIAGCAEINLFEAPSEVLKHPLGTDPIRVGMTKDEIIDKWGGPDQINHLEPADEWKISREEWVYIGRYSKIPLDRSYLFKTKYLIFDGDNLVSIGDESQCKAAKLKETEE